MLRRCFGTPKLASLGLISLLLLCLTIARPAQADTITLSGDYKMGSVLFASNPMNADPLHLSGYTDTATYSGPMPTIIPSGPSWTFSGSLQVSNQWDIPFSITTQDTLTFGTLSSGQDYVRTDVAPLPGAFASATLWAVLPAHTVGHDFLATSLMPGSWFMYTSWSNDLTILSMSGKLSAQTASDPVPEPSSLLLLGSGIAGLVGVTRKRLFFRL